MPRIKCGHCSNRDRDVYHPTRADVRACSVRIYGKATPMTAPAQSIPSSNERKPVNPWRLLTPRPMVEAMRNGRYAVPIPGTPGETKDQHTFIRVSRPTHGRRRGCLVVQTQHSESYAMFILITQSGTATFAQTRETLDMALMMVAADPYTSARRYADIFEVCSRCGKQLTDAKSRWYGIGPECEKHWPELINIVNEEKGIYVPS